ncbi:MAG TPA: hypothetical protein PK646_04280 [Bacillota bacterium]|jgi:hypothetical protein|nr:hypothetical protein [Fastidiosipila sp.]HPX92804.1 hypothetical protein [Bacillota bacterium]HQB81289.1 hypothetical protein [Bacillota bacterium]
MRQSILCEISEGLKARGVPLHCGYGTDIMVNAEFLDAKWPVDDRRVHCEVLILANENHRVVYMYGRAAEINGYHSFGVSADVPIESGKTLHREVKRVQYGPDGQAHEYAFDLGAIPETVEESARRAGWKFRTVTNKKKALYPAAS